MALLGPEQSAPTHGRRICKLFNTNILCLPSKKEGEEYDMVLYNPFSRSYLDSGL